MASDETMTFHSSFQDEHDFDDDAFDHHHHHHHQHQLQHPNPHNLSRLSVCTSSTICEDYDDVDNLVSMTSRFSIESFEGDDGDADAELSSDSENEFGNCYSLPSTPRRRRSNRDERVKEYASDNEGRKRKKDPRRRRRRRRSVFDFDRSGEKNKKEVSEGFSGESDQSGVGVKVITRPKGGKRSLCMDLEEVKACRDLGFELELPSSLSFSNSTLDTSSGSNSPIANWRISAPGDDPRDVKARLKVWAQAVALATYGT